MTSFPKLKKICLKNTWDYLDLEFNSRTNTKKENLCLIIGVENEVCSNLNPSSFETSSDSSYSSSNEDTYEDLLNSCNKIYEMNFKLKQKIKVFFSRKWKGYVGDPTSTRDENISLYISGCKPHPISQLYGIELDLKSILWYDIRVI